MGGEEAMYVNSTSGIGSLLSKLEAIRAVERRKKEGRGIIFTKSFITFMTKCIRDDSIPLRTAGDYRAAMHRYSPVLGLLSDSEVFSLMAIVEYHIENAGKNVAAGA